MFCFNRPKQHSIAREHSDPPYGVSSPSCLRTGHYLGLQQDGICIQICSGRRSSLFRRPLLLCGSHLDTLSKFARRQRPVIRLTPRLYFSDTGRRWNITLRCFLLRLPIPNLPKRLGAKPISPTLRVSNHTSEWLISITLGHTLPLKRSWSQLKANRITAPGFWELSRCHAVSEIPTRGRGFLPPFAPSLNLSSVFNGCTQIRSGHETNYTSH